MSKIVKETEKRVNEILNDISTNFSFEYGVEYEIAFIELLKRVLPLKYGVCRGYVVTKEDKVFGDDIIIFDQSRFPTIRHSSKFSVLKKEYVPLEAVYAYIELKNTLYLEGTKRLGQSLEKALHQTGQIKKLEQERGKRMLNQWDPYVTNNFFQVSRRGFPEYSNPIFTAIIGKNVKKKKSEKTELTKISTDKALTASVLNTVTGKEFYPDFITVSEKEVLIPTYQDKICPFNFAETKTKIRQINQDVSKHTYFILTLLWSLDTIRLSRLPWQDYFKST